MTTFTIPTAAVALYINGKPYGAVSGFHWSSMTPHKETGGIDSLEAQELIPVGAAVRGSFELYRITGSGGMEGIGVTTQFDKMGSNRYFVLQLIDMRNDTILFQARSCVADQQSWDAPVRSLVTGSLMFKGLTWDNEAAQR